MKTKIFLISAGLAVSSALAQSGGSGGSGGAGGAGAAGGVGGAGSASGGTGSASGSTAAPSTAPAAGANAGSSSITSGASAAASTGSGPGASAGSRSIVDTAGIPATDPSRTNSPSSLPAGVTAAPTPGGVSPLTGIPTAEIPTTSRATQPVAADGTVVNPTNTTNGNTAADRAPIVPAGAEMLPRTARDAARQGGPVQQVNGATGPGAVVYVPTPPPSPRTESAPSTPEAGRAWVPGHYAWSSGEWTWVGGSWQRPPSPGATWVPGNYDNTTHRWTEGYWDSSGGRRR